MFKKNDTLRNVLLAMLACVALLFASCNQAVDDGNYVKLNDGNPVTAAMAIDAITNQRGGSIFVKLSSACQQGELETVIEAIKANSSVMVELDLSETWHDADEAAGTAGAPDIFGGVVEVDNVAEPGSRKITAFGDIADAESPNISFAGIKNLKSISLPFTVQTIGKGAFEGCENLEEVTINFFFTSDVDRTNLYATEYMYDDKFILNTIDEAAFKGCKNLRTFILVSDPDNDGVDEGFPVSLTKIGAEAFKDCYSLEGVRFFNTRNLGVGYQHEVEGVDFVAHLDNLKGPNKTKTLYYEDDFGGRNVLSEYSSGIDSTGTKEAVTGDEDQQPLEIGVAAFENCTSLEYVDFTGKSDVTGTVAATGSTGDVISDLAFNGCEKLATIIFPTVLVEKASLTPASPVDIYTGYEVGTGTNGQAASLDGSIIANCAFGKTPGKVIKEYGERSFQYTAVTSDMIHDLFHFTDFGEPSAADVVGTVSRPYHGSTAATGTEADYVDYIGERAFFGCANIDTVELPSTITADMTKLGDGAFANTGVQYIWVHANDKVFSIVEDWLGIDHSVTPAPTYTKPAPYWRGALVDADPADRTTMPETIYAWFVTPYSGDLTYLPLIDSQNPNTKVLGDDLKSIKGDAFYKNVDVEKILFPTTLVATTAEGIGAYAFCKAENLTAVAVDADLAGWGGANQGMGAFSWNPVTSIMTNEGASGRVNK